MRGALAGGAAVFLVDLSGSDVFVAEQLLHFPDIDAGIEQKSSAGGAQGMRIVDAVEHFPALRIAAADHRSGQRDQDKTGANYAAADVGCSFPASRFMPKYQRRHCQLGACTCGRALALSHCGKEAVVIDVDAAASSGSRSESLFLNGCQTAMISCQVSNVNEQQERLCLGRLRTSRLLEFEL
jgi:hypothetical protein